MFSKCQIQSCFGIMAWAVFVLLESVLDQNVSKCQIQSCFWIMTWAVFVLLRNVFKMSDPILFWDYGMGSVCDA